MMAQSKSDRKYNKYRFLFLTSVIICIIGIFITDGNQGFNYRTAILYFGSLIPFIVFLCSLNVFIPKWNAICNDITKRWTNNSTLDVTRKSGSFKNFKLIWKCFSNIDLIKTALSTPKGLFLNFLGRLVFCIWAFGWLLYDLAIISDGKTAHSLTGSLLYSAMSSFDLFLVDINGNIIDNIDLQLWGINFSGCLAALITITAVLASCSLLSIIIGMFLTRIIDYIKASEVRVSENDNKHVYIFWGENEKAIALSQSINGLNENNQIDKEAGDPHGLIVFINPIQFNEDNEDGWSNIVELFSSKRKMCYDDEGNSKIVHLQTHYGLEEAIHKANQNNITVWSALDLNTLNSIIEQLKALSLDTQCTDCKLHIFFLSEDRDKNVSYSKVMAEYFNRIESNDKIEKVIYCATRKDSVTSVIEDKYLGSNGKSKVRIIDDAHLSVEELKRDVNSHPVKFVDINFIDSPGAVKSKFTSLIIGFGETGRDAFRYLFEFGAFVKDNNGHAIRAPFESHIIDPNINNLKNHFINSAPALFDTTKIQSKLSDINCSIKFHNIEDTSAEFYQLLKNVYERLNYVVIATGNDELNATIAVRILNYIVQRKGLDKFQQSKFRIFIRAYEEVSFSHLNNIVNYYNHFYGNEHFKPLQLFGNKDQIYSYKLIVKNEPNILAEEFHNNYEEAANDNPNWITKWETLIEDLSREKFENREDKSDKPDGTGTWPGKLADVRRKINESQKNSLHMPSKVFIIERALDALNSTTQDMHRLSALDLLNIIANISKEKHNKLAKIEKAEKLPGLTLQQSTYIKKLLHNLSVTEHLRWNASHQLQGYIFGIKHHIKKTHNCLVDWEYLPDNVQNYDFMVVETSLKLHINKYGVIITHFGTDRSKVTQVLSLYFQDTIDLLKEDQMHIPFETPRILSEKDVHDLIIELREIGTIVSLSER